MTKQELATARFVAAIVAGNGDARRMSNVLRVKFTPAEREELAKIARKALNESRS